jgi:soluble lytic murein transglycosylase
MAMQPPASLATRALVAQLALKLGLPDVAVAAARLAGRDGFVLPRTGWPRPYVPPQGAAAPALVLGVMRQESSFDPEATSAAGAHGLMQVMPATARQLAASLGAPAGPLDDPDVNMRLGAAYLGNLLAQFPQCQACAIAAYNAGPHRVHAWIAALGTPEAGDATIDWIESLPYAETRNYVERVMENTVVYGG